MEAKDRIIVALDIDDFGKAFEFVDKLSLYAGCFKIGQEFITSAFGQFLSCHESHAKLSLEMMRFIFSEMKGKIFWDGEFNGVPGTVAGTARAVRPMGVKFFTVHASADIEAVQSAAENKGDAKLLIAASSVSLELAPSRDISTVVHWVRSGADGIVCSPQELRYLHYFRISHPFIKIAAGVRPAWAPANDGLRQEITPREAVRWGADYFIIGLPITNPPAEIGGPVEAVKKIIEEIKDAEKGVER